MTPLLLIPFGVGLLILCVYGLSEFDARRKDVALSSKSIGQTSDDDNLRR
jgi:hypothetical protein